MLDVIGEMRKYPDQFLISLFYPRVYFATTIDDFVNNMKHIKPTKNILGLGLIFYGSAVVRIPSVSYNSVNDSSGAISDVTSSLYVRIDPHMSDEKRSQLRDGMRLYSAWIGYRPKDRCMLLFDYKTEGPLAADGGEDAETLIEELGMPSFASA